MNGEEAATAASYLVAMGMPKLNAIVLVDKLLEESRKHAEEILALTEEMDELAHKAVDDRDAALELSETWSSIACANAAELGRSDVRIAQLERGLRDALGLLVNLTYPPITAIDRLQAIVTGADGG